MPAMKTVTYGVMHFVVAVTVAFAVTGSWVAALGVGIIEPMIQTVAYTLHEKAWARRIARAPGEKVEAGFSQTRRDYNKLQPAHAA